MPAALAGCYVISLRPVGAHAAMRRAAARHGARVLALSPWRLSGHDDTATRRALRAALAAPRVVFTSPAAVRHARAAPAVHARRGQVWCAVGAGTAAALHRAGVAGVVAPTRMDSEGLLALPALAAVRGTRVGLVTAPGGRDRIAPALHARGADVLRADVYERIATFPAPRALAALRTLRGPAWLALSSGEALQLLLAALPDDARARLARACVVAASPRLAQAARDAGFDVGAVADNAQPAAMLAAAAQAQAAQRPRRRRARA